MNDTPSAAPGACILCPDPSKARLPYRPPVCDACRSWLAGLIGDIRIRAERLAEPEPEIRDDREGTVRSRVWVKKQGWVDMDRDGWRDPIAHALTAAPIAGERREPRVSGTHGAPVPVNLTTVDLGLRAWQGSRGPHARGVLGLDEEQVGDLSLATVLDTWVRDWRTYPRCPGDQLPDPTVDAMTRWLADRLEWACDEHPTVVEFADDMRTYRSALRRALGESERDEYKEGVACPKCHMRTLVRRNGSEWVECQACPAMLSPTEYATHIGDAADATRQPVA